MTKTHVSRQVLTCNGPGHCYILWLLRGRIGQKRKAVKAIYLGFALFLGIFCHRSLSYADTIYVSTFNDNTIYKIDSSGNVSVFATASSGLNYPLGLAFDNSGNLYAANDGNNTIEEFNSSGTGSVFATSGLNAPTGLAFDASGNLYVANYDNNTIEEFNSSGTGSVFATATSGVDHPYGLAFDSKGNLYVANAGNETIEEFGASGTGSVFATSGVIIRKAWPLTAAAISTS